MHQSLILALATLLSLLASPAWPAGSEEMTSRPDAGNGPTQVQVSLYVLDVISINSANGSFNADFVLRLRWKDQRLSGTGRRLALSEVWNPKIGILNQRSVSKGFEETVELLEGGVVQYAQRYLGEFSAELDFRRFPMDIQHLPVKLISFGYSPEEVALQIDASGSTDNLAASGWTLTVETGEAGTIGANLIQGASESILRSFASFPIRAERDVNYFRWKVLLPLTVVIFLSWATFWIDPQQIGPQISVSATAILTLVAFLIRLDGMLPPVSYLTHMDRFVYVTLLLVFLAFVETMAGSKLASKENGLVLARRMDAWSRVLFPVAYAIVVYVFWIG